MPGNSFGTLFKVTTFGESHGPALGAVLDGVPPGLELDAAYIQKELDRRKPGQSKVATARNEADQVEILSGLEPGDRIWYSYYDTAEISTEVESDGFSFG